MRTAICLHVCWYRVFHSLSTILSCLVRHFEFHYVISCVHQKIRTVVNVCVCVFLAFAGDWEKFRQISVLAILLTSNYLWHQTYLMFNVLVWAWWKPTDTRAFFAHSSFIWFTVCLILPKVPYACYPFHRVVRISCHHTWVHTSGILKIIFNLK